jgi:hypothetical protein
MNSQKVVSCFPLMLLGDMAGTSLTLHGPVFYILQRPNIVAFNPSFSSENIFQVVSNFSAFSRRM